VPPTAPCVAAILHPVELTRSPHLHCQDPTIPARSGSRCVGLQAVTGIALMCAHIVCVEESRLNSPSFFNSSGGPRSSIAACLGPTAVLMLLEHPPGENGAASGLSGE
jgi:hypothetical protein